MKAIVFDGRPHLEETAIPEPPAGEALIRVTRAGICSTDREILRGYMGFEGIPGHEFAGVVETHPDAAWTGKRVVGEINCVCHACRACEEGRPHHCEHRSVLGIQERNGAFAEYLTLPTENLHALPDALDDDIAVFTEPTAAAFRILEQIDVAKNDRICVLGDGKLGQLIAQVLAPRAGELIAVGRQSWKRDLLAARGIHALNSDEAISPGFDIVVEATGSPQGFQRALSLVRPEGTVVLKTTIAEDLQINLSLPVVVNEVRIIGSRCGPFPPAIEALASGAVDPRPMITARYPLAQGVQALQRAQEKDMMKVLIDCA